MDGGLLDALAKASLFSGLARDKLELVAAHCAKMTAVAGQNLISENDHGNEMYLLVSGRARVIKSMVASPELPEDVLGTDPRRTLAELSGQDSPIFGEMALLEEDTRSATVTTVTACELVVFTRERFFELIAKDPDLGCHLLLAISRKLASSVRRTNADVIKLTTALALVLSRSKAQPSLDLRNEKLSFADGLRAVFMPILQHFPSFVRRLFGLSCLLTALVCAAAPGLAQTPPAAPPAAQEQQVFAGKAYVSDLLAVRSPTAVDLQGQPVKVLSLLVKVGDRVARDQPLLRFEANRGMLAEDERGLNRQKELAALAKLAETESKLSERRNQAALARELANKGLGSQQDAQSMETDANVERARLESQAAVLRREVDRSHARAEKVKNAAREQVGGRERFLRAPREGTVLWVAGDLAVGAFMLPDQEMFKLGTIDPLRVRVPVGESVAQRLAKDMKARVVFDARPETPLDGVVEFVSSQPEISTGQGGGIYYVVEVEVPNPGAAIKDGFRADVRFFFDQQTPAAVKP